MAPPDPCPRCGARLPDDAPEESLCPQCLLKLGLDEPRGGGNEAHIPTRETAADSAGGRPDEIGPYKILDILGEGGMGIVYLAEQTEPVRRRVAIKLIKLGMDTRQVIARFEAERQALALMNHPNVAKVFDAGVTESGRPYFVMEYVPGIQITEYCDLRCLSVQERLDLFMQVCEAIQHAHQKGIIHRDVKPTNVLVSSEEDKTILKVIDFGVAKATSQRLTERTLYTQQGILIGTPEYMSPEQAQTTALDVDTRTDIYSLGVLLYELLVGALPFDPQTLRRAATVEMLRIIREEDPPRPTIKFSSLGNTAEEVAKCRHADIASLAKQLKGELEWITMRALEKDRSRRYGSASEFAADVRRHLDDEPVFAGPPSQAYRFKKFVKKNKGTVAATLAIIAAFALATIVSTTMYLRSESAKRRVDAEALRSRLDTAALQAALLGDGDGYRERSREALEIHRELLDPDDPEYAVYLVNRLVTLQFTYWGEGLPSDWEALIAELESETVEAVQRTLPSRDPRLIEALDILDEHFEDWNEELKEWAYREALALRRELLPDGDPSIVVNLEKLSEALEGKGRVKLAEGYEQEGGQLLTEAADLQREALALRQASSHEFKTPFSEALQRLTRLQEFRGGSLLRSGNTAAAEPLLLEALELAKEAKPNESRRVADLQCLVGRCLVELERFSEAENFLLAGFRRFEGELGGKSASTQEAANALVELYERWNRPSEADTYQALLTNPTVLTVRELGPLVFREGGRRLFNGRYGGYSTMLAGRSLWVFDVSLTEQGCAVDKRISHICSGSWSWTEDLDASDGIGTLKSGIEPPILVAEPIPYNEEEAAYNRRHAGQECVEECDSAYVHRPYALASDPARGRVIAFYQKGLESDGMWTYEGLGRSIALWTDPMQRAARPAVELFSSEEPDWGSGALSVGDDLYSYACDWNGQKRPCFVARVPLADVLDRGAWRFYAGDRRWSAYWREAVPVMDGAAYLTVHRNDYLDKYLAIHAVPGERKIALRTADSPEGPWSEARLYIVGESPPKNEMNRVECALAHPEFAREGGRIEYITYRRQTGPFWLGETRLVEITFR